MFWCFDELFSKRLQKVDQFVKKHEKSSIWPNLWNSRTNYHLDQLFKKVAKSASFREKGREIIDRPKLCNFSNYHVFAFRWTFQEKVAKSASFREKGREIIDLAKTLQLFKKTFLMNFQITMSLHFDELFRKKLQKVAHFEKKNENSSIWPELATFRANYHVLAFSWTFQKEVAKSALFREKAREIIHFTKTCNFSRKLPCLDELYGKKLQKLPHFVKKHENSWIWPKLCNFFEQTTMFWCFDELLNKSLQKVAQFVKKHEKSSIWPKLCKFPNKPPCLCISMNFSAKSCKKCLISWKSTKNHRFGQNFATYRTNYHVFAFRWTFQVKVAKSASFREKARKTINLAKTFHFSKKQPCLGIFLNSWARNCKNCLIPWKTTRIHRFGQNYATFSNKLPCFGASVNFSAKVCRKWLNSWKSTKNHRFGQNFATFQTNYHVFAFRWTFQEKVATSASFREKAWETIDLAKTFDFSKKLPFLGIFLNFWARSWKNCLIPWKSTRIHRFGQNYDTFCNKLPCFGVSMNFSAKGCRKWINSWKSTRNHRYGQLFATFPTNYHVFAFRWTFQKKVAKSASFREEKRETIDLARTGNFSSKLPCLGIVMNFSERSCKKCLISWESTRNNPFHQNLQLFEKTTMFGWTLWQKVAKTASFREKARKLMDLAETMQLFRTNYHVLVFRWTVEEKFAKSCSIREKARKIIWIWPKLCKFPNKPPCLCISMNFSGKSCKKCLISWKSTKNHRFGQNFATFRTNYHVFAFRSTFQEKVAESASFCEKARKIIDLAKSLELLEQTTTSLHFDQLFRKKLQKVRHFVKKDEKSSILPNLWNFSNKLPCLCISINFSEKNAKSASFRQEEREFIDLARTGNFSRKLRCLGIFMNFSERSCKKCLTPWKSTRIHRFGQNYDTFCNKLPCFGVSMNFSAKGCRKWINSWKSTKNHRFGQIFGTSRTNYHVFAFRSTFQEKVAKSASFREKGREIIDLAKTLQLFKQITMSLHFDEIFRKKLQKVAHFEKKNENSSIWPELATFRANYHVLAFSWTFQKEVAKSALFREKAREIIHFTKTCNFSRKLPCLDELYGKKLQKLPHFVKKHENSWIWPKLCNFFEQTTMFWCFDELLNKSLQKVAQFVKKHEKSSIWPKLCKFPNKPPCLCISMNFSAKSCKKCLISWKSTKNHRFGQNFATYRTNYHVFAFRWTFQVKVAKSASFREKARKTINLAKTFHFSKKQPCLGIFLNSWARNCKNCLIPWKTTRIHRFGQNYATFSNKLPCFGASVNFSAKVCRKWLNSWKSTKNHRFGQNFATFQTNYHVFAFRWTFQEKVATSASFREKAWETIDLAKTFDFSKKLPFLGIFLNFWARSWKNCLIPWKSTRIHRFGQNYDTFCNKLPCFGVSMNFSAKGCRKWINSWKSTRNHRYGQLFATFPTNYHVFAFRWTFQKKVAKSASFREEKRETIDLARTGNFSSKLPCLGIVMNFSERSCKKCLISWESTRNNRFHQNLQLFEKTTMFGWTLWQKVAKTASFREKARKLMDLAETMQLFRTNYHVLVFRWTVEEKFAKSCSIREKARKIIDLAKTVQVSEQTAMSLHFDELFRKKLQKMPHFVKKHEKSSIWPKLCNFSNKLPCVCISINFSGKSCRKCLILWKSTKNHRFGQIFGTSRTNYHVFAFRSTFQEKVAKSASFREKGREIIDLAKSLELFEQTTMSLHFDQLFRKKCKKCLISTRRTRIHRFGQNWQLFEETTMSWHFHELFRKKLQKVPHSVEKHENSSIWPKLWHFL